MVSAKELEREIALGDGQSVIGVIDPNGDIGQELVDGRPRWTFHLMVENEPAVLRGGKRLKNAFLIAGLRTKSAPFKVRVKATGAPRSFDRDYTVEEVK